MTAPSLVVKITQGTQGETAQPKTLYQVGSLHFQLRYAVCKDKVWVWTEVLTIVILICIVEDLESYRILLGILTSLTGKKVFQFVFYIDLWIKYLEYICKIWYLEWQSGNDAVLMTRHKRLRQ